MNCIPKKSRIDAPRILHHSIAKGEDKGKYQVEVLGFDYYNPKTGNVDSGGKGNIAVKIIDDRGIESLRVISL